MSSIGEVIRLLLIGSGCVFWLIVVMLIVLDIRARHYMKRHSDDLSETDFDKIMEDRRKARESINDAVVVAELVARLRNSGRELTDTINTVRNGVGIIALEDYYILEEVNLSLAEVGLKVVSKGQ